MLRFPPFSYLTLLEKGQRLCAIGRHRVSIKDCTFLDGSVHLSCEACFSTVRDER